MGKRGHSFMGCRERENARFVQRFAVWLALLAAGAVAAFPAAAESNLAAYEQTAPPLAVTLRAASRATLYFETQNGQTIGDVSPQARRLPHLVLYRNGALTPLHERTLVLEVTGIQAPASGVTVTLEVETVHPDPDLAGENDRSLSVWQESRRVTHSPRSSQASLATRFELAFGATVVSGGERIATPTDYFGYRVTVTDADHPPTKPLDVFVEDHAFLMENQWVAQLAGVQEASPGAAPDELLVFYCDMFPFYNGGEPLSRLPRDKITDYVGDELVPPMVEAFRVQTDEWGFPWSDAWTSYRPEHAEQLSVALGDGSTWFHDEAPATGHSGISLNVSSVLNAGYDTLADALLSSFHHELFHNLQRNLTLDQGGDGRADGKENAWQFFSEGTAALAPSVGQPSVQFSPGAATRTYVRQTNWFLQPDGVGFVDLLAGRDPVAVYSSGLYWRFLYEQCGGMHDGIRVPAAGMQIIRRALTVLYSGEVVDISASTDLLGGAPRVLDRALAGSSCPFQTYEGSLAAFARAIYALGVEDGRCTEPGLPAGCGFYDPHSLYYPPRVWILPFAGTTREVQREAMRGFEMTFFEIRLDQVAEGKSPAIEILHPGADGVELDAHILYLVNSPEGGYRRYQIVHEVAARFAEDGNGNKRLFYALPPTERATYDRLGLILTRLDAQEIPEPMGKYTILLHPGLSG